MRKSVLFVVCIAFQSAGVHARPLPEEIASMTCREFGKNVMTYTDEQAGPGAQAEIILQTIRQSPMFRAVTGTMNDLDTDARRRIEPAFIERFIGTCPILASQAHSYETVTVKDAFDKAADSLDLDPTASRWGLMDAPDSLNYDTMTCMEIVEESRKIKGRPHNPVNDLAAAAAVRYLDEYDLSKLEDLLKVRTVKVSLAFMSAFEPETPCKEVMDKAAAEAGLIKK